MYNSDATHVVSLMEKVYQKGIKVSYKEQDLTVRFPLHETVDQDILNELKNNKQQIISYLKQYLQKGPDILEEIGNTVNKVAYSETEYFEVSRTQVYWLDDEADPEYKQLDPTHGAITLIYKATGNLDTVAFWDAVVAVANRHESLRSTFHKINGSYYMKVAKENTFAHVESVDLRRTKVPQARIDALVRFADHKFILEKGPLFLCRIVRTGDHEHIISLKMHHVISDSWSNTILIRDLLKAYTDIRNGKPPEFTPLKYQYKEFLSFINNYTRENYDQHKRHWKRLYSSLPGKLDIPGAITPADHSMKNRVCRKEHFNFPAAIVQALHALTRTYETSLFVILQATVKTFMLHKTGQGDMLIGTFLFGRDYTGTEDQIGCYAKTRWIRTVLQPDDSFHEAIKKVKQSNADMKEYWAYSLSDMLNTPLFASSRTEDYWKINMQYTDLNEDNFEHSRLGSLLPSLDLSFTPVDFGSVNLMPIAMQLFFMGGLDAIKLEVQYNSSLFNAAAIKQLFEAYFGFLRHITGHRYKSIRSLQTERRLEDVNI